MQHSHASLLHHPRTKKQEGRLLLKPPGKEQTTSEHGKSGGQCPPSRLCAPRPCQQCRPSPPRARRQCRQGMALKQVETRCFLTPRTPGHQKQRTCFRHSLKRTHPWHLPATFRHCASFRRCPPRHTGCMPHPSSAWGVGTQAKLSRSFPPRRCRWGS